MIDAKIAPDIAVESTDLQSPQPAQLSAIQSLLNQVPTLRQNYAKARHNDQADKQSQNGQ